MPRDMESEKKFVHLFARVLDISKNVDKDVSSERVNRKTESHKVEPILVY